MTTPCAADLALRRDVARETGEYVPSPFDVLIDGDYGRTFLFARAEARQLCAQCPIMAACLSAHRDEDWAKAILGHDLRKPPTVRETCGKPRGASRHHSAGEHACETCKKAERERWQKRRKEAA